LMNPALDVKSRGSNTIRTKIEQIRSLGRGIWLFVDDHQQICQEVARQTSLSVLNGVTMESWNVESPGRWITAETPTCGPRQVDRSQKAAEKFKRHRKIN